MGPQSDQSEGGTKDGLLELESDAWERFERAVDRVAKARPKPKKIVPGGLAVMS